MESSHSLILAWSSVLLPESSCSFATSTFLALATTSSSTKMGAATRRASAMASEGRESTAISAEPSWRWITAKKVFSRRSLTSTLTTRASIDSRMFLIRSWVMGRGVGIFSSSRAMALASKRPTQMGSERFSSSSRRMMIGMLERGSSANPLTFISSHMGVLPLLDGAGSEYALPRAGQLAAEAVRERPGNEHRHGAAHELAAVSVEVDHAIAAGASGDLVGILAGAAVHEHGHHPALEGAPALGAHALRHLEDPAVAPRLHLVGDLLGHVGGGRAGTARVTEGEDVVVAHALNRRHRLFEVRLRLPREAHDEVGGQREVRHRLHQLVDELEIAGARVASVHPLEHAIGAGLERQVQVLDHLGHVADGADETRGEVVGIRGGEADALDALDLVDLLEEGGEIGGRREIAAIGIHGLPEERHLAHAGCGELADLGDDGRRRMTPLPPAGHGDDAERAVLLAAFHHGDEGLELSRLLGTRGELDERRLARLEHGSARGTGTIDELAHARDGGGAEDEIDVRRALLEPTLPELRHAPHDADHEIGARALEVFELAQPREDLVLGLLPDRAGVEEDQIGVLRHFRELVALLLEQTGDALGIVLVHLAAVGDQMKFRHKRSVVTLASASGPVKLRTRSDAIREDADLAELLEAVGDQRLGAPSAQLTEGFPEGDAEILGRLLPVAMRPAQRLRHHAVDDAELEKIGRGHPHQLGRLLGLGGLAPQDGRASLGRDDGVDRVLEHEQAVAYADGEGASAAALAGDHAHDRRTEACHLAQIARNGLPLPALLGAETGIGAGRVDEGHDGLAELGSELHEAEGLAISLGMRHAEVAGDVLARVASLLMPDHHHGLTLEARETAHDGLVVAVEAIAVELHEVLEEQANEVQRVRALRVTGDLRPLPGRETAVDLVLEPAETLLELADLVARRLRVRRGAELSQALFDLDERAFELKLVRHTRRVYCRARAGSRPWPPAPARRPPTSPSPAPPPPGRRGGRARRGGWDRGATRRCVARRRASRRASRRPASRAPGRCGRWSSPPPSPIRCGRRRCSCRRSRWPARPRSSRRREA